MTTTVLIADEQPGFRRDLRELIDAEPGMIVVAEAGDGAEAVALMRGLRPHIAVLDIAMPGLDGLDGVGRAAAPPPRLVLLAQLDRYAHRARDLGALGYLRKEDAAGELGACLRSVARGAPYVATALRPARPPVADPRIEELTADERRVLGLLGQHKTSHQIGEVMSVDHRVVQNHCATATGKLGLRGHQALVAFAVAHRGEL